MRGYTVLTVILIGCCLKIFGQCPTQGVTVDSPDPSTYATDVDYSTDNRKLYVVGGFNREIMEIGGVQLSGITVGTDTSSMFLLQYSDNGVDWLRPIGKAFSGSTGARVKAMDDGAIVGVKFVTTVDVGGVQVSSGYENALLLRTDSSGNIQWVRHFDSDGYSKISDIDVDELGNIYVYGHYHVNLSIEDQTLQVSGNPTELQAELYTAKFDSDGDLIWLRHLAGGIGYDDAEKMLYDNGFLTLSGFFSGELEFDQSVLTATSSNNGFVFQLDTAGNFVWYKHLQSEVVRELDMLHNGSTLVLAGVFQNELNIDSEVLNSSGGRDGFVASFDSSGGLNWMRAIGGTGGDDVLYLNAVSSEFFFVSGIARSDFIVDGLAFTNMSTSSQWNGFTLLMDFDGDFDCIYSAPSLDESRTWVKHVNADTAYQVGLYQFDIVLGDSTYYCSGNCGSSIVIGKTCMECSQLITSNSAVRENSTEKFTVYPNPATNQLNINLSTNQNATAIGMLDMLGREVLRQPYTTQIDVSHLPAGNYIVAVYTADGVLRERVSVVR